MHHSELIEQARESALQGKVLDRKSIIALLDIDPDSKEADKLGKVAREVAAEITQNRAGVWASIGVDFKKCPMNCRFCAFGDKWDIIKEESEWNANNVVDFSRKLVSSGAKWITLRTTQFYDIEKLAALAKKIRAAVPGNYKLVANTGELDNVRAGVLLEAGFQVVYHSLRLREGIDTKFAPEERMATLQIVKNSPLELAFLVEPVGIEHSNEELADVFLTAMKYGAVITGAMARVPVPGTPLGKFPAISERRHAQIVAVTRLAAGYKAPDICVHPPSQLAMEWGANVIVVEVGAVPRDTGNYRREWKDFDMDTAKKWFNRAGYNFY